MKEIYNKNVKEIYDRMTKKPLEIYEIFKHYYTEERVDLQNLLTLEEFEESFGNLRLSDFNITDYDSYDHLDNVNNTISNCLSIPLLETIFSNEPDYLDNIASNLVFNDLYIYVHFPEVRITNEHDRFVEIKDLYAQIKINCEGKLVHNFKLNRATYPIIQFNSDYMHSHISGINTDNFTRFSTPCTGSGPVNDTALKLYRHYDENDWALFCLELDKFTQVESLEGVPYRRLENIGANDALALYNYTINFMAPMNDIIDIDTVFSQFIPYFLSLNSLKFSYNNGSYGLAMSFTEYTIKISNAFIDWYNEQYNNNVFKAQVDRLIKSKLLRKVIIANDTIYSVDYINTLSRIDSLNQQTKVLTFKGNPVYLKIDYDSNINNNNIVLLLPSALCRFLITSILKIINYKFQYETNNKNSSNITTGNRTTTDITKQKVKYI